MRALMHSAGFLNSPDLAFVVVTITDYCGVVTGKPRQTRQGDAVKQALKDLRGFSSAQDVYACLRSDGDSIGLSTVYRHLQALAGQGVVDVIQTAEGEATYRFCGISTEQPHHHHLVCRRCGATEEIQARAVEKWAAETAAKYGYIDIDHTVEVFGICASCAAAPMTALSAESR